MASSLFTPCMWLASEQAHFKHQNHNFDPIYSKRESVPKCLSILFLITDGNKNYNMTYELNKFLLLRKSNQVHYS